MKIQTIRDMKTEELKKFIEEKKAEAVSLRFDIASKQTGNHRQIRSLKKEIAQAMTVLREKAQENNE